MSAYQDLEKLFRRVDALGGAISVLNWDQATMMPDGGAAARAEQLATLSGIRHGMLTEPAVNEQLAAAEAQLPDDAWQAANLREMRRLWRHANALDPDLVEARARVSSACEMRWRQARADNDFAGLVPLLGELIEITRQVAAAKAEALRCSPYEALLDEYEPGGRVAAIDRLFADLAGFLPSFMAEVRRDQAARGRATLPAGPFPVAAQRELGIRLMENLGFDFRHGRLDVSLHPFTGGVPDDVRITTRYADSDFTRALMGVLHETGHALYERGLPAAWRGQPVGEARGMVMHESQSLLVEMQVCRGREFLGYLAPLLRQIFAGAGPYWREDNLARAFTRVEPGLIRVDADEVTYPLHVILRYRIERGLLTGDLALADLPAAWRDGMRELLGVEVPDDRDGCLQDIHWPSGAFGYFPTYTLGALAAAQLFAAACAQDAAIRPGIAKGDFAPLLAWLKTHVHGRGALDPTTDALLVHASGRPLGTAAFEDHLCVRYLAA